MWVALGPMSGVARGAGSICGESRGAESMTGGTRGARVHVHSGSS